MHKFSLGMPVIRVPCPPDCTVYDCRQIPLGTVGVVSRSGANPLGPSWVSVAWVAAPWAVQQYILDANGGDENGQPVWHLPAHALAPTIDLDSKFPFTHWVE